ncbi:hypothetical protein SAMN05444000_103156 [Shimia gijangensis]|uniref:Secreted protein n=1 Tax=Shimia gijangensis TaxID=1470563 RepID=A0A1M6EAA5_9RHOB|nr:DUF1223 domain-containing protein [Shimia gijangensis]SHI82385.1 hypothetical protein SAMN05444000_103156 [Shimia gijangensis]
MIRLSGFVALFWMFLASFTAASEKAVVVELFTSQGCSSCPPADKFFHENLSKRDDVIALSLHVDYWDYLGWKDNLASPAYTKRQRNYARAAGHRSVYTPQMIIGGKDHVVGNHPYEVKDLIAAHKKKKSVVDVSIERSGNRFVIRAETSQSPGAMVVHLVRYRPAETVEIKHGENAGRSLIYANIVEDWDEIAQWDGKSPLQVKAPGRGDLPAVVIVQKRSFGPILAAAKLK